MAKNLPGYATVDIRTVAPWRVNAQPNTLFAKQKFIALPHVNSTMEHQMEVSKLGLTTIPDFLGTKGIQLKLNFPNTSGNQVTTNFSTRLNGISKCFAVQVWFYEG